MGYRVYKSISLNKFYVKSNFCAQVAFDKAAKNGIKPSGPRN